MDINLTPLAKTFQTKTEKVSKTASKSTSSSIAGMAKKDTITISREGMEKSLSARLARATANEIDSYATPEKLSALRQKIQAGEYNISSAQVANAILGIDVAE